MSRHKNMHAIIKDSAYDDEYYEDDYDVGGGF